MVKSWGSAAPDTGAYGRLKTLTDVAGHGVFQPWRVVA